MGTYVRPRTIRRDANVRSACLTARELRASRAATRAVRQPDSPRLVAHWACVTGRRGHPRQLGRARVAHGSRRPRRLSSRSPVAPPAEEYSVSYHGSTRDQALSAAAETAGSQARRALGGRRTPGSRPARPPPGKGRAPASLLPWKGGLRIQIRATKSPCYRSAPGRRSKLPGRETACGAGYYRNRPLRSTSEARTGRLSSFDAFLQVPGHPETPLSPPA